MRGVSGDVCMGFDPKTGYYYLRDNSFKEFVISWFIIGEVLGEVLGLAFVLKILRSLDLSCDS